MMNQQTPYEQLGGEAGVRALVDRFYDLMDRMPESYELRQIHPKDLGKSREKLFMFLSGWLGGPPLYMEAYGHPRLRQRHMPFKVGERERDQWMLCMREALAAEEVAEPLRTMLYDNLWKTADFMRNQG